MALKALILYDGLAVKVFVSEDEAMIDTLYWIYCDQNKGAEIVTDVIVIPETLPPLKEADDDSGD
jgi:hypothetical protein